MWSQGKIWGMGGFWRDIGLKPQAGGSYNTLTLQSISSLASNPGVGVNPPWQQKNWGGGALYTLDSLPLPGSYFPKR